MDDIAKRLGISKGTVSKALSGAADVSETMRKAVLEAAVELGYSRVSRGGSGKRLCVFVENMAYEKEDDFGRDIIIGFRKLAEPADYQVDVVPLDPDMQKELHYDEYMLLNSYQGAVFLGLTLLDPWMKDFQTCSTPAVLYDNHIKSNPAVTHVGIDNDEGMNLAVSRLVELGHRKIGYLSGALGSYVYQARYTSFFYALRQNRLDAHQYMAGYAYRISECLERHLPRLLDRGCTAIICSHDLLAHMLLIHCGELGLRVPEDLSVIGIDDIPLCRYTIPPLHHPAKPDRAGKVRFLRALQPDQPGPHQHAPAPRRADRAGLHRSGPQVRRFFPGHPVFVDKKHGVCYHDLVLNFLPTQHPTQI